MIWKLTICLFLLTITTSQSEVQYYVANSEVNFREGPSTSYRILDIINTGDTIQLIETTNTSWAKIKFNEKEGYSSLRFFEKINYPKNEASVAEEMVTTEENNGILNFWVAWLIFGGLFSSLFYFLGRSGRNRTLAVLFALFTGFMGLQKFYLGKFMLGLLSLIFFWTLIPLIVGLWDTIRLALMSNEKFQLKYNESYIEVLGKSNRTQQYQKLDSNREVQITSVRKGFSRNPQNRNNSEVETKEYQEKYYSHNKTDYTSNESYSNNFSQNSKENEMDLSIIDINEEKFNTDIPKQKVEKEYPSLTKKGEEYNPETWNGVPYWGNFYVYSYEDIRSANYAQKSFYRYFRNRLLKNQWTNIEGNTNYAFILYFELLNEYEKHQNIKLLETQLKLLGECCIKTRNYSFSALTNILSKRKDQYSKEKLEELRDPSMRYELGFADNDPYAFRLGRIYKEKLNLSEKQEDLLNKFYNPSNVFNSIEGCCITIIHLFLSSLNLLNNKLVSNGSSLDTELSFFKNQVETTESSNSYVFDFNYMQERVEEEVFLVLFKRTENIVREDYNHKRKLSEEFSITEKNLHLQFEERLGGLYSEILDKERKSVPEPDLDTQIALNAQNVNRWKIEFKQISSHLKSKDEITFIKKIKELEASNQKNPNIENIFFEASKSIAKYNKTKALEYYAKYIDYDLNSDKIHNKKLTKTVQKSLFKNDEQLKRFERIIQDLINHQNLEEVLVQLKEFYKPVRRKIVLNKKDINEAKEKHQNTVNILSDYLEDEEKKAGDTNNTEDEIEISITRKLDSENSIFLDEIGLNILQRNVLKEIAENSFTIQQNVIQAIALKNGQMKNQLVDSINEICADILDGEFIIEEDEETYIMEESFYTELLKK